MATEQPHQDLARKLESSIQETFEDGDGVDRSARVLAALTLPW